MSSPLSVLWLYIEKTGHQKLNISLYVICLAPGGGRDAVAHGRAGTTLAEEGWTSQPETHAPISKGIILIPLLAITMNFCNKKPPLVIYMYFMKYSLRLYAASWQLQLLSYWWINVLFVK